MPEDRLVVRCRGGEAAARIARTIKRLAPQLRCNGCGKRDFALAEEPSSGFRSGFLRRREGLSEHEVFHPVATVICTTCGHVHQFSDGVLIQMADPVEYGEDVAEDGPVR